MLLKNLMEDKQLNFNQPFLSVRRYSLPVTSQKDNKRKSDYSFSVIPRLPPHLSELKSGPVSNPGAVPFLWEQTPGQPKEEKKRHTQNLDSPPIAPKLPPGRNPKASQHDFLRTSDNISQHFNNGASLDENVRNSESSKKKTEEEESSESGDSDELFVDARDTLSRTESFFLNCSMSGLSGFDDLDLKMKPSGSFSTDPQTREFMMDRFLPAAMAMVSEAPQYAPKKQPVVQEQPQQLKKILMQDQPSLRYGPSFSQKYSHYHDIGEEEESDDDYDQRGNLSAICGLLPQFCLKSSLSLINPLSKMSMRSRVPISPANKSQSKSSSAGSYSETENKSKSDVSKPRPDKIQIVELDEKKTRLRTEQNQLESNNTSTYCDAPLSFLEEKEVLSIPQETKNSRIKGIGLHKNGCKTFREFLADQESPNELDSEDPVVEKTLYVDTIHKVESLSIKSSPNAQDTKVVPDSTEERLEIITKRIDQMHFIDLSLKDLYKLDSMDGEETLLPDAHKFSYSNVVSSIDKSYKNCGMELPPTFGDKEDVGPYSTAKENTKGTEKEVSEALEKLLPKVITLDDSHQCHYEFPVPPPLPKSPSDSWLWRTLPSASKKSLSRRPYTGVATTPQNHCSKALTSDAKWETIVKTTTVQRYHLRYSNELLTPVPEA